MTSEERIYKLCEYTMDLIDELSLHDAKLGEHLEWVREEIMSIREDIRSEYGTII